MIPVHLILSNVGEKLLCGTSRFWGNPDLPKGFKYPMYIDDEGDEFPYFFVCQINLADVAPCDESCNPCVSLVAGNLRLEATAARTARWKAKDGPSGNGGDNPINCAGPPQRADGAAAKMRGEGKQRV